VINELDQRHKKVKKLEWWRFVALAAGREKKNEE
jgi:hypothetical protein